MPSIAAADFALAVKAYQAGRFTEALNGFRVEAELGHAESMFNLGVMYWTGEGVAHASEARLWIERASFTSDVRALRTLSGLLATSSVADAALAQKLLDRLSGWSWIDPTVHEIRAAAHARGADYAQAVAAQEDAIRRATALGRDLAALQRRREFYAQGRPWLQPIEY